MKSENLKPTSENFLSKKEGFYKPFVELILGYRKV